MISLFFSFTDPPRSMIITIVSHVLSGAFQGLALALLVPFLSSFLDSGRVEARWLIMEPFAIGASMALPMIGSATTLEVASFDIYGDLTRKVGSRVQVLPLGWFDVNPVGRVTTATSTSISPLSHLPSVVVPKLASMAGMAFTLLLAALIYDWKTVLAMAACIPLCIIAPHPLTCNMVRERTIEEAATQDLSMRIPGFARLQVVLCATGCLKDGWEPLSQSFVREHEMTRRAGQARSPATSLFHASVVASLLLAVGVVAFQVLGGVLEPGVFITLSLMAVRFVEPIGMSTFYIGPLHEARAALGDIASIVHVSLLPKVDESQVLVPADPFDLELDCVDFAYVDGIPVITDLNQALPGCSITALVGPSGSGKSTLVRLIARFWDADSGAIHLDGPDVRETSNEVLIQRISMVFQEVHLSNTPIEENVRIGRLTASDAELVEAVERVGLSEVVEYLPEGWKTIVGEGDSALPGGERQRAVIVRASLKDSPVLLLDEATSVLDGVNEASVTSALAELSAGRSVVVTAHRLSTTRRADRILVFRDGVVETPGSHEELYEAGGTYREFWDDQSHVERWRIRDEEPRVSL